MKEQVIVSLTTWYARINNIPAILETILNQSIKPDLIVINLAFDEIIPVDIQQYIDRNNIEIFRTEDTKVYKKFLPTLKRYPDACVINIDDDLLYPPTMIEDFMSVHKQCPNNPICGNHTHLFGHYCHCGEASLTKRDFYGEWLDKIDVEVMNNCKSSDMVFTYMATKAGHPYIPAKNFYGTYYQEHYNAVSAYTDNVIGLDGPQKAFGYLEKRFGVLPGFIESYVKNTYVATAIETIYLEKEREQEQKYKMVAYSRSYKLGRYFIRPIQWILKITGIKNYD